MRKYEIVLNYTPEIRLNLLRENNINDTAIQEKLITKIMEMLCAMTSHNCHDITGYRRAGMTVINRDTPNDEAFTRLFTHAINKLLKINHNIKLSPELTEKLAKAIVMYENNFSKLPKAQRNSENVAIQELQNKLASDHINTKPLLDLSLDIAEPAPLDSTASDESKPDRSEPLLDLNSYSGPGC